MVHENGSVARENLVLASVRISEAQRLVKKLVTSSLRGQGQISGSEADFRIE